MAVPIGRSILSGMSDLFSDAARERISEIAPLALRLRPRALEEFVGQQEVLGEGTALRLAIAEDRVGVRGTVGGLCLCLGRSRDPRAGARPPRGLWPADDPLPRRDPPLQQGTAVRAAAGGRRGAGDAYRRDAREP